MRHLSRTRSSAPAKLLPRYPSLALCSSTRNIPHPASPPPPPAPFPNRTLSTLSPGSPGSFAEAHGATLCRGSERGPARFLASSQRLAQEVVHYLAPTWHIRYSAETTSPVHFLCPLSSLPSSLGIRAHTPLPQCHRMPYLKARSSAAAISQSPERSTVLHAGLIFQRGPPRLFLQLSQ